MQIDYFRSLGSRDATINSYIFRSHSLLLDLWKSCFHRGLQDRRTRERRARSLEETIFFRQQELVLNADKIAKREIEEEERDLTGVLELMLETKMKKLGFPEVKFTAS